MNPIKYWVLMWISFLWTISLWLFAYNELSEVNSWDTLTSSWYNKIVQDLNSLKTNFTEFETSVWSWSYLQKYFDTNEVFTWNYDALTNKKIYSKWVYFGTVGNVISKISPHDISWIDKVVNVTNALYYWNSFITNRTNLWVQVDRSTITVYVSAVWWSNRVGRFKIEYTKL